MNTFVYLYLCYESHNSSNLPENTENMLQNKYCKTQYESSFLIKILNISILPDDRIFSTLHETAIQGTGGPKFSHRNILINKFR